MWCDIYIAAQNGKDSVSATGGGLLELTLVHAYYVGAAVMKAVVNKRTHKKGFCSKFFNLITSDGPEMFKPYHRPQHASLRPHSLPP